MRTAAVVLAAVSVLLVAAVAAPSAEAHQRAGRTVISVDGEQVKNTRDDHFTYRQTLSPGCHRVEVVQRQGGNVSAAGQRECSRSRSVLTVEVDHADVSIGTYSRAVSYDSEMAR